MEGGRGSKNGSDGRLGIIHECSRCPSQEFSPSSDELSRLLVVPNSRPSLCAMPSSPDPAHWEAGKAPPSTSATTP